MRTTHTKEHFSILCMFCVQNGQLHGPSFYEYYKPESADKIILQFKLKLEFLLSGHVKRMRVKGQMFFCDCLDLICRKMPTTVKVSHLLTT